MEIAEDAEEEVRAKRQSTVPEERPPTAKTASVSGSQPLSSPQPELPSSTLPSASHQSSAEAEPFTLPPRDKELSEIRPRSPTRLEAEPRKSSQSTRPDIYSYASYSSSGRPKVKLGPRPSLDVGGRPHTSGAASFYRPVSTLPAGLKLFSKGSKKEKDRPKSQYTSDTPSMTLSPPPIPNSMMNPTQEVPARPHTSGGRSTAHSNAFMKPLPSPTFSTAPKTLGITPEKARLLKAMELRKKQMSAKVAHAQVPMSPPASEHLSSPTSEDRRLSNGAPKEVQDTLAMLDGMAKGNDFGIAFDARSTLKTDESDATRSDSYPVSPVGPSERAESTRASSISESTDETVQEPVHAKEVVDKDPISEEQKLETNVDEEPEEIRQMTQESTGINDPLQTDQLPQPLTTIIESVDPPSEAEKVEPVMEEIPSVIEDFESSQLSGQTLAVVSGKEEIEDEPVVSDAAYPVEEVVTQGAEELTQPSSMETKSELESTTQPISPAKQMKIPRSKFSVQDLRAVDVAPEALTEPLPSITSRASILLLEKELPTPPEKSPVGSSFSEQSLTEDGKANKRQKRKGLVEPIRTDLDFTDRSGANSDAHFSDDDDLMDELSSAVVEEAKHISVSKSPISPVFPSPKKQNRFSRVFSAPIRKETSQSSMLDPSDANKSTPQRSSSRSVSAAASYLNSINKEQAKPIAKTVNLGSGISQRIKALEKFSSTPTPPTGTTAPPPGTSTSFFSVRKASTRAPSKSPSIAERANSLTRNSPSPSVSRESSPETVRIRERSGSIQNRLDAFKSTSTPTPTPRSRPESISVTARIIRDPAQPFPAKSEAGKDPADYTPLDLKQSPLIIDHKKAIVDPSPKETIQERRLSKERRLSNASKSTTKERRSSITIIKDLISDRRTSFSERRKSINLESSGISSPGIRSPSRPPSTHASPAHHRPMSISSRKSTSSRDPGNGLSPPPTASSLSSNGEDKPEKKSNRASRMMRRMSSSLSAGRKQISAAMSPTVREEIEPIHGSDSQSLTPSYPSNSSMASVNIGDVNVQFPDSLLWKRRSMLLDSQGFLLLSPALTAHGSGRDKSAGGALRRFHLSEFRTPCIPDVEMQELPNSVVLDFVEGGGLQVACEDRAGQARVLQGMFSLTSFSKANLLLTIFSPH